MFPRDMVCLRNISVDTLHKGDTKDKNNNNDDNNNNNIQQKPLMWRLICPELLLFTKKIEASSTKQVDLRVKSTVLQECRYNNHCGISWPLVTYSVNFSIYVDSRKHRRWAQWHYTSTWRYPNGILPWLVVQSKYMSSNQKLPVRT